MHVKVLPLGSSSTSEKKDDNSGNGDNDNDDAEPEPLAKLPQPFLKMLRTTKIKKLTNFVAKRLKVPAAELEMLCRGQRLGPDHSMEFVYRTLVVGAGNQEFVVNYRRRKDLL